MRPWWVGWYMPADLAPTFELHSPYWESGLAADADGNFTVRTMVAAVLAETPEAAKARVVAAYDSPPADVEWRWEPELLDRSPFSGRFPQAEWMAWSLDQAVTCRCSLPTCDGRPS